MESGKGSKELHYLLEGGLVKATVRVYKNLSRQMIVEGRAVDRSLAALCKMCLSLCEEVPSGHPTPPAMNKNHSNFKFLSETSTQIILRILSLRNLL